MTNDQFLTLLQKKIAGASVGPSTARGMGPKGTIAAARKFLSGIDLSTFSKPTKEGFDRRLDSATGSFLRALPKGGNHWGSCRKFLNIFLRDVVYNRHLASQYKLTKIEPWLELPLDSHVANGLRGESDGADLPRWKTVIGLTPTDNRVYQDFALQVAKTEGTNRIHLDLRYFRRV